jgi:hypothetical protein
MAYLFGHRIGFCCIDMQNTKIFSNAKSLSLLYLSTGRENNYP